MGALINGLLVGGVAYGDLHVHPLAAKKTLAKYKMVGLGRNNNFTTIRLLDYIIYACRATVAGLALLKSKSATVGYIDNCGSFTGSNC